jgi:WD40 repeat protein
MTLVNLFNYFSKSVAKVQEDESPSLLGDFIPEMLFHIFTNLQLRDLSRCLLVNKKWNTVAMDERLLKHFLTPFGFLIETREGFSRYFFRLNHEKLSFKRCRPKSALNSEIKGTLESLIEDSKYYKWHNDKLICPNTKGDCLKLYNLTEGTCLMEIPTVPELCDFKEETVATWRKGIFTEWKLNQNGRLTGFSRELSLTDVGDVNLFSKTVVFCAGPTIHIFDRETFQSVIQFKHSETVKIFSSAESKIASHSKKRLIKLWDANDNTKPITSMQFKGQDSAIKEIFLRRNMLAAKSCSAIQIWDVRKTKIPLFIYEVGKQYSLFAALEGSVLALGEENPHVYDTVHYTSVTLVNASNNTQLARIEYSLDSEDWWDMRWSQTTLLRIKKNGKIDYWKLLN